MSGLSKALGSLVLILFTQAYLTLCSYVPPQSDWATVSLLILLTDAFPHRMQVHPSCPSQERGPGLCRHHVVQSSLWPVPGLAGLSGPALLERQDHGFLNLETSL